ncbi:MAG TPA: biotin transporter BioY [Pseudonocardiaceae bacterium]|nr:biotin transporter BioY [Pseudonocardiaceae bacterium]
MSSPAEPTPEPKTTEEREGSWLLPRDLALIALFAALIAVLGLPGSFSLFGNAVPITAQSMGVMLAGSVLGAKRGFLAVLALEVLVAAGLPLLAGGRGGIAVFAGVTGGYLVGWLAGAAVIGWLAEKGRRTVFPLLLANVVGGIVVIYAFGVPFTAWRLGSGLLGTTVSAVTFLPGDAVKVVLTALITAGVYRSYPVPAAGRRR